MYILLAKEIFRGETMEFANDKKKASANLLRALLKEFLSTLVLAMLIGTFMYKYWTRNLNLYHTVLELICVFIALCIFMSIWFIYEKAGKDKYILCFGFLTVAFFDIFHAYYHLKLDLTAIAYFDLSTRFWILARLAEAGTILMVAASFKGLGSKYLNLSIALGVPLGTWYFMINHHDKLPMLLTAQGVTPIKVMLEYAVIVIYIVSIFMLKGKLHENDEVTYKYIFISLLMGICAEICFTLYSSVANISWTMGHILKIVSYFYLFKGVFVSAIIYPYEVLAEKNRDLEQTYESLNLMNSNMKDLLDALPVAVQSFDSKGGIKYTNKRFAELFECEGKELKDLAMSEISAKFLETPYDSNAVFRTNQGRWIRLSIDAHKVGDDTIIMLNETKKEQELENLHIQTETILNAISNGVMVIDVNKRIIIFNQVFEEIYEIKSENVIGMNLERFNEMTGFEERASFNRILSGEIAGETLDAPFQSFRGNNKELRLHISSITNVEGEIIGAVGIGTDITAYKEEQQRLIQQEKLALMGQMGASIVHETRNFLTTIKGRCQIISMITRDEGIKQHALKIDSDVEEVNHIISEFLFLSKPREIQLREISVSDVFESIKILVETSSMVKGVALEVVLGREERYMQCDESQLKQVILNICKNAVDAMQGQMEGKLTIETGYDEYANEVFISIRDNGKGISQENLAKLGDPFFTTKHNGTGLGLSVCFKIIKEHQGRIEIKSTLGKGTEFRILLPCMEDEEFDEVI